MTAPGSSDATDATDATDRATDAADRATDATDQASGGVDAIVAAWQRERPDLDASPLHVLSRVSRLGEILADRRKKIFAAHVLRPYEFDVLAALRRAGEPYEMTPGQLIAQTHVTSGTMTNRLDVLLERQLIRRRADADDRRVMHVQLTDAGRTRVDSALTELLDVEAGLLRRLDESQRRSLAAALQQMLDTAGRPGNPADRHQLQLESRSAPIR